MKLEKWKVHYKDETHDIETYIESDFSDGNICYSLTLMLDDIEFKGMEFADWEVANTRDVAAASRKFKILKWGKEQNYCFELQRYNLEVEIPINVIDIASKQSKLAVIHFGFERKRIHRKILIVTINWMICECFQI